MYGNMKRTRLNDKKILILLLISLFIFSQELRSNFSYQIYNINILGIISLFLLAVNNFKKIKKPKIIFLYITLLVYIFSSIFYENKIQTIIAVVMLYIVPLILTIIEIDQFTLKDIFKWTLLILNTIIVIITIVGILEIILNFNINIYIGKFMSANTQEQIIYNNALGSDKRLYSFMGHPLFNTELYLMFFVLNILYYKYLKKESCPILVMIISVLGIAFTGSKAGFALLFLTIILLFKYNNIITKVLVIMSGMIIAFKCKIFDNVLSRFAGGSLTTGRNEKWIEVQSTGLYPIKFFTGYGRGFTFQLNSYIDWASAAFEYPMRMFSLELGILVACMIYMFIMIIPTIILIKRKQYYIFISYLIVFLDVNTFNGLSISGDKMMIFCLFIFLILNLSNYILTTKLKEQII